MSTVLDAIPQPTVTVLHDDGSLVLTITAVPTERLMIGRWYGHATPELVEKGARAALGFMHEHPELVTALSDSTLNGGDWAELMPWLQYAFLPHLIGLGVRAIAFIPSGDANTRLGLEALCHATQELIPGRIFEVETEARQWLLRHSGTAPAAA